MCSPHSSLRKNIWSSVPGLSIPLRGRGIVKEFGERAWVVRGNWTPNGLEMSRPASSSIVSQTRFAAAGRVGSIELLGSLGNHSGTTAIASISMRKSGLARPVTNAKVMAGGLGRFPQAFWNMANPALRS